jgi:hypothetical protein
MARNEIFRRSRCACGSVAFVAEGPPIVAAVCYCSGCQAGGAQVEALPGAASVLDPDGGTPYLVYRDDRFRCLFGAEHLEGHRLSKKTRTTRYVAACCNTPMYLKFGPGHWISAYRPRFEGALPEVDMRIQTRRRTAGTPVPDDAPSYPGFPLSLILKLARARIDMLLGR